MKKKKSTPEMKWKSCTADLGKDKNWDVQFEALEQVKKFAEENPEFFGPSNAYQH